MLSSADDKVRLTCRTFLGQELGVTLSTVLKCLTNEEYGEEDECDGLQPQSPAVSPHEVVEGGGHRQEPASSPAHHDHLHQLTPLLEVLAQHQHEAVLGHGDPGGHDEAVADVDLVELRGEGGEETAESDDEAANNSGQSDGLFLKVNQKTGEET